MDRNSAVKRLLTTALAFLAALFLARAEDASAPGVKLSELGLMRLLVIVDDATQPYAARVAQRLTEAEFRVFESPVVLNERVTHETMKEKGTSVGADLVLHVRTTAREKKRLGKFELHEGEATVALYSPITGETLVSQTSRVNGERHADAIEAGRSARERSIDEALKATVKQAVDKEHRLIVHRAEIGGVTSNEQLLGILEYVKQLKEIHHVRRISHDLTTGVAILEILASPRADSFWRTHLSRLPRTEQVVVEVVPSPKLREAYPSWFKAE
jgi:hypothetical protein